MDQEKSRKLRGEELKAVRIFWTRVILGVLCIGVGVYLITILFKSCQESIELEEEWVKAHQVCELGYAIPISPGKPKGSTIREILEAQATRDSWYIDFALWQKSDSGLYIINGNVRARNVVLVNKKGLERPQIVMKGDDYAKARYNDPDVRFNEWIRSNWLDKAKVYFYLDLTETDKYLRLKKK